MKILTPTLFGAAGIVVPIRFPAACFPRMLPPTVSPIIQPPAQRKGPPECKGMRKLACRIKWVRRKIPITGPKRERSWGASRLGLLVFCWLPQLLPLLPTFAKPVRLRAIRLHRQSLTDNSVGWGGRSMAARRASLNPLKIVSLDCKVQSFSAQQCLGAPAARHGS